MPRRVFSSRAPTTLLSMWCIALTLEELGQCRFPNWSRVEIEAVWKIESTRLIAAIVVVSPARWRRDSLWSDAQTYRLRARRSQEGPVLGHLRLRRIGSPSGLPVIVRLDAATAAETPLRPAANASALKNNARDTPPARTRSCERGLEPLACRTALDGLSIAKAAWCHGS